MGESIPFFHQYSDKEPPSLDTAPNSTPIMVTVESPASQHGSTQGDLLQIEVPPGEQGDVERAPSREEEETPRVLSRELGEEAGEVEEGMGAGEEETVLVSQEWGVKG